MRPLELISQMCEAVNLLSDIVKKQQTEIERSKIEESVKEELRQMEEETDGRLDVVEHYLRRVIDTDDGESFETDREAFEKGAADDD